MEDMTQECIGMERVHVEANVTAIIADVIRNRPDMTEAQMDHLRDHVTVEKMVYRGALTRCPVHTDRYITAVMAATHGCRPF